MIISWWPPIMWTNLRKYMLWKLRWSEFPCFPHDPIPSTPANSPGVTSALSHVDATWICGSGANYVPVGNSWNSPNTDKNEWVHIGDVSVLSLKNRLYIQDSYVYVFFLEIYSYPKNSPHDQKWSECLKRNVSKDIKTRYPRWDKEPLRDREIRETRIPMHTDAYRYSKNQKPGNATGCDRVWWQTRQTRRELRARRGHGGVGPFRSSAQSFPMAKGENGETVLFFRFNKKVL